MKDKPTYQELERQIAELEKQNADLLRKDEVNRVNFDNEKREKLNILVKNSNDIIVLINSEGQQYFISDAVKRITGYEPEELFGPLSEIVHPDDLELSMQVFDEILNTSKKEVRLQFRHKHKEKGYVWMEAVGQNYLGDPLLNAIIVNSRDISKQKENELKLKQANEEIEKRAIELRKLNVTKDKLLSILAHDLREPFSVIIGYSDLLLDVEGNTDQHDFVKFSEVINSTAKNSLNLFENLLKWAKSQTNEIVVNIKRITLSEVVLEIVALMDSQAKAKNIFLDYSSNEDVELHTDEDFIKTILRNLISNALKFTKEGGSVKVITETEQNMVKITIADSGVGISKEKIETLFDITSNEPTDGTNNEKGSGLGLILSKEFVNELGGQIWVESEVGKGSNFIFTLPLNSGNT